MPHKVDGLLAEELDKGTHDRRIGLAAGSAAHCAPAGSQVLAFDVAVNWDKGETGSIRFIDLPPLFLLVRAHRQ